MRLTCAHVTEHLTSRDTESEEPTCRCGPIKEDRIGNEDEQHWGVGGDVVRDGMLKALLTAAPKGRIQLEFQTPLHRCEIGVYLQS